MFHSKPWLVVDNNFVSVLRGHSVYASPPQRPMTSDFEGFSIPYFIHYIYVNIYKILNNTHKQSFQSCWTWPIFIFYLKLNKTSKNKNKLIKETTKGTCAQESKNKDVWLVSRWNTCFIWHGCHSLMYKG